MIKSSDKDENLINQKQNIQAKKKFKYLNM